MINTKEDLKIPKSRFAALVLTWFALSVSAFSQTISYVIPEVQNNKIHVHFQLNGMKPGQSITAGLFVSKDSGVTFEGPMINVSGDTGPLKTNGEKNLVWDYKKDMAMTTTELIFEVRADMFTDENFTKNEPVGKGEFVVISPRPSETKPTKDQPGKDVKSLEGDYRGELKNGKMHGKGTYYFKVNKIVVKDDPFNRKAEAGDSLVGTWKDGVLVFGELYHNGRSKPFRP